MHNIVHILQVETILWFEIWDALKLQNWLSAAGSIKPDMYWHRGIWSKSTKNRWTLNFIQSSQADFCNEWNNPCSPADDAFHGLLCWKTPNLVYRWANFQLKVAPCSLFLKVLSDTFEVSHWWNFHTSRESKSCHY